jgi:hypothetical protein
MSFMFQLNDNCVSRIAEDNTFGLDVVFLEKGLDIQGPEIV